MNTESVHGVLPPGQSQDALIQEVARVLHGQMRAGQTALVAVSGGADSVALAWLAAQVLPPERLAVVHVRHGLRDDAQDAACAQRCAAALGLAYHEAHARIGAGAGPEAAARDARFAALERVAAEQDAAVVMVAHTADDQAETVLLNLARGSGLPGAAGMAVVRGSGSGVRILRPLLRLRRQDVRAICAQAGLEWVEDPTNADPQQRRARARHELLPGLARLTGQHTDPVAALVRFADHARREDHALDVLAQREFGRIGRAWGPVLALPASALQAMPEGLALRVLRVVVATLGEPPAPYRQLAALLRLASGQAFHRGGLRASSGGGWLAISGETVEGLAARQVAVGGLTPLPEIDLMLHADDARDPVDARIVAAGPPGARLALHARLPVPPDAVLTLRARRPGDRVRLRHGSRSLQDVLTDAGAPRLLRDLLPVIVDSRDEPVWVPGFAVARMPESLSLVRAWLAHPGAR